MLKIVNTLRTLPRSNVPSASRSLCTNENTNKQRQQTTSSEHATKKQLEKQDDKRLLRLMRFVLRRD